MGRYALVLPQVRDVVELTVNGARAGKRIVPPYRFEAELKKGRNRIELTVYNSLANAMEFYLEDSGIFGGGKLFRRKDV